MIRSWSNRVFRVIPTDCCSAPRGELNVVRRARAVDSSDGSRTCCSRSCTCERPINRTIAHLENRSGFCCEVIRPEVSRYTYAVRTGLRSNWRTGAANSVNLQGRVRLWNPATWCETDGQIGSPELRSMNALRRNGRVGVALVNLRGRIPGRYARRYYTLARFEPRLSRRVCFFPQRPPDNVYLRLDRPQSGLDQGSGIRGLPV